MRTKGLMRPTFRELSEGPPVRPGGRFILSREFPEKHNAAPAEYIG
jgi:hypothetical protein